MLRREIIASKPLLRRIYCEWYELIRNSLPGTVDGRVLELGSGAGFFCQFVPDAIPSELFLCPDISVVADAQHLPFRDGSLRAIAMVDVLHHLPECRHFFAESARCVAPGGAIVAVEPWVTTWSRVVYRHFHHEPFRPEAQQWEFPPCGPLSGSNQALPWILFERDRAAFEREYPEWKIAHVRPMMPFQYLVSGGVGLRSLAPAWVGPLIEKVESAVSPAAHKLGMFAHIVLVRTAVSVHAHV